MYLKVSLPNSYPFSRAACFDSCDHELAKTLDPDNVSGRPVIHKLDACRQFLFSEHLRHFEHGQSVPKHARDRAPSTSSRTVSDMLLATAWLATTSLSRSSSVSRIVSALVLRDLRRVTAYIRPIVVDVFILQCLTDRNK